MKLQHLLNKILIGLVTAVTGYAATQFTKLTDAVTDLGKNVAITMTQVTDDRARLDAYGERLSRLETSHLSSQIQGEPFQSCRTVDYTRTGCNISTGW